MKKYIVRIPLTEIAYELTGTAGNTASSFSSSVTQSAFLSNKGVPYSTQVGIQSLRPFKVKKARLFSTTLPVEGNSILGEAGRFGIEIAKDGNATAYGSFTLILSKWNEWEDKDIEVSLTGEDADVNETGCFRFTTGSRATIYDFNVQEDLVGNTITPVLEMEIEAEGMIDSNGNAV